MKPKYQRLVFTLSCLGLLAVASWLVLSALSQNMLYFYMPSDLTSTALQLGKRLRLGGLVKEGSIVRDAGLSLHFIVTDGKTETLVSYTGYLPALFREGQGVIAEGSLSGDVFQANKLLAKHDEKYMPPEIAKELREKGVYRGQ